jgi:hypothetical protein
MVEFISYVVWKKWLQMKHMISLHWFTMLQYSLFQHILGILYNIFHLYTVEN